jgi:hypothetical protein
MKVVRKSIIQETRAMKATNTINVGILLFVWVLSCSAAETGTNRSPVKAEDQTMQTSQQADSSDKRLDFVKMVDFYLNDGTFVSGRLISEDRNKVIVEEIQEGGLTTSIYGKREINSRTLQTKGLLEYKYYLALAEHFASQTWDFQNDPDDFIQAIRCYEKARQLLEDTDRHDDEISQINEKIKQLQADRKVWTRETESRSELKKLEFEATLEKRLKELESTLNTVNQQLDKNSKDLDSAITTLQNNYQRLETSTSRANENIAQQLKNLENRVTDDERMIERGWLYPRIYYRSRTNSDSGGTQ